MLGGEEEREEDSKGGQAQGRSFQDRKRVSVGCWKLMTGSQRGRAKMGEPESQEPGFVSGDFHAKQEKPRVTGSVLARMLLAPPSSSDPAQPSESKGWGCRQGNSSSSKQHLLSTYCMPSIMLSIGSLPSVSSSLMEDGNNEINTYISGSLQPGRRAQKNIKRARGQGRCH